MVDSSTFFKKYYSIKKIKGTILELTPLIIIVLLAFSSLVVDISILRVSRAELQTATDAAALAGANALINGGNAAVDAANNIIDQNSIIGHVTPQNVQIQLGTWDSNTGVFTANDETPVAVKVTAEVTPSLVFGNMFTSNRYTVTTESIAALIGGPRDIMFIVDLTPAMDQYSQLSAFPTLSISQITNNLQQIYNAMNLPQLGNMTWTPRLITGTNNAILKNLGLQNIVYPFPGGSWNEYINYVKSDSSLAATGYANQYGYLTFVNYLLSQEPQFSETPVLWKTPEQPLQSVKNSIDTFIAQSLASDDRIGLVTYNTTNGNTALLEEALTSNFGAVSGIMDGDPAGNTPGRQAAHYSSGVNMLSAISAAIDELNADGRPDAQWIIYLLTAAQLSNSGLEAILNQAQSASNNNITINTVTVGANGNMELMQEIAQITGGTSTQISPSTDFGDTLGQIASLGGKAQIVH